MCLCVCVYLCISIYMYYIFIYIKLSLSLSLSFYYSFIIACFLLHQFPFHAAANTNFSWRSGEFFAQVHKCILFVHLSICLSTISIYVSNQSI